MAKLSATPAGSATRFPTLFDQAHEETCADLSIRSKNIRARVVLATSQMVLLPMEAAAAVAVAIEICHASTHAKEVSLLPKAIQAYLRGENHVESPFLLLGLHRLLRAIGTPSPASLTAESTLDDLRQVQLQETGHLFAAAMLIPKDMMGIGDDGSQGLALDIFSKELSSAFRTLEDLEKQIPEEPSPQHILFYLPLKEVKSMTLQRLNSATLSLSSTWGEQAQPLVQIAQEFTRRLENAGNAEI